MSINTSSSDSDLLCTLNTNGSDCIINSTRSDYSPLSPNSSSIASDCGLLCTINALMSLSFFTFLSLPGYTLGTLYVLALITAKNINWKMRVILINLLAPEFFNNLSSSFENIRYLVWTFSLGDTERLCDHIYGIGIIGYLGNLTSIPFFATAVYIFIKFDENKLKWSGIFAYIAVTWTVNLILGVWLAVTDLNAGLLYGFCIYELPFSQSLVLGAYLTLLFMVGTGIMIVFSILTYGYVKKNTISQTSEAPNPVKKALTKVLIFEVTKAAILIMQFVVSICFAIIRHFINGDADWVGLLLERYFSKLSFEISFLLSPVIAIIFLKPVRDALKQMRMFFCCKACLQNQIQPH